MKSIMFNFRTEVPLEEQDALLKQINSWSGISSSGHLKPDSENPAILKMCYAYISNEAETERLIEKLLALPEIESAFIPAAHRFL
jgi:hypothetical protein